MAIVFGSLGEVLFHAHVFSAEFTQEGVIEETGWRVSARMAEELHRIYPNSLLPIVIDNSNYIQFQEAVGFDVVTATPLLSNIIVLGWQMGPGEVLDGLDNNGNGRIDEGFVATFEKDNKTPFPGRPAPGQWKGKDGYWEGAGKTKVWVPPKPLIQFAGNILAVRFNSTVGGISYSVDVGLIDADGNVTQKTFTQEISFR